MADNSGATQSGTDNTTADNSGTDKSGTDNIAADNSGTDKSGTDGTTGGHNTSHYNDATPGQLQPDVFQL
jgi:hypothetical protein